MWSSFPISRCLALTARSNSAAASSLWSMAAAATAPWSTATPSPNTCSWTAIRSAWARPSWPSCPAKTAWPSCANRSWGATPWRWARASCSRRRRSVSNETRTDRPAATSPAWPSSAIVCGRSPTASNWAMTPVGRRCLRFRLSAPSCSCTTRPGGSTRRRPRYPRARATRRSRRCPARSSTRSSTTRWPWRSTWTAGPWPLPRYSAP